jgi:dTDP-4-dehydrorhamnose reductase
VAHPELLFGAGSMLGWSLWQARGAADVTAFCNRQTRALPAGIERGLDLNDEDAVARLFAEARPRLIVHCAGICDVEVCETSPDFAHDVNVEGTRLLIAHAPAGARIVYCSSDHVFGGDAGPYDEDAATAPISVYGRTRVAAEKLVLARPNTMVVRSGLWIGPSATGRIGHLDWLRHRHRRGLPMTVVADEIRSAVWAADAAQRVWALARSSITGVRHVTATRAVSRPELASYCDRRFAIGATFGVQGRRERRAPHIGNVELATRHADALAAPLPSVVP